jgi:hypothetical protein
MAALTLSQEQIDAAYAFANATMKELNSERGVHAETAVAAAARMAGAYLFRSFGFALASLEPGQYVLSEQANEQRPRLVAILSSILSDLGIHIDESKRGPPGAAHQPQLGVNDTQMLLGPEFAGIREGYRLSLPQAAEAGAVATAIVLSSCAQVLDPNVAFNVAVMGFIEGTKTAPDPAAS